MKKSLHLLYINDWSYILNLEIHELILDMLSANSILLSNSMIGLFACSINV